MKAVAIFMKRVNRMKYERDKKVISFGIQEEPIELNKQFCDVELFKKCPLIKSNSRS